MPKIIKGPWIIEVIYPDGDFQCRILAPGALSDGNTAIICGEPSRRGGYANIHREDIASLISAAPDLLKACKMGLDAVLDEEGSDHSYSDEIKRAIAKAEGRL